MVRVGILVGGLPQVLTLQPPVLITLLYDYCMRTDRSWGLQREVLLVMFVRASQPICRYQGDAGKRSNLRCALAMSLRYYV